MKVKVKFFTLFRLEFGISEIVLNLKQDTIFLKDLLKIIDKETGKKVSEKLLYSEDKIKNSAIILVNGKNIFHLNGLETFIQDGDEISLFPPGGGG